jgi:hypothetical protein
MAGAAEPAVDFQPLAEKPKIQSPAVSEASGVAVSPTNPDFLWIVNDSGAAPEIHLTGTDGSNRGKVILKDSANIDWEDLASFKLDGKSYLLVADAGDNQGARESCTFYVVREPELPAAGKSLDLTLKPAWRIDFRYEGGPRDCEAAAVDSAAGKIVFLSKRTKPPELYELPLRAPKAAAVQVAHKIGQTEVKAPVTLPFFDQPTGMDISADGSQAAVVTYYGVFIFPRGPKETWSEAFAKKGTLLAPHQLPQAESVAFSRDGKTLFVISEGVGSPIQ